MKRRVSVGHLMMIQGGSDAHSLVNYYKMVTLFVVVCLTVASCVEYQLN